jgi:hypothetical protein
MTEVLISSGSWVFEFSSEFDVDSVEDSYLSSRGLVKDVGSNSATELMRIGIYTILLILPALQS